MFGSSVVLGDLNDFIAPSQACVNPMFVSSQAQSENVLESNKPRIGASRLRKILRSTENSMGALGSSKGASKISLTSGAFSGITAPVLSYEAGSYDKVRPDLIKGGGKKKATVSLNDCLACSGCVTSAETVLIKQQSVEALYKVLDLKQTNRAATDVLQTVNTSSESTPRFVVVSVSAEARASLAVHFGVTQEDIHWRLRNYFLSLGVDFVFDASSATDISLLESRAEFVSRFQNRKNYPWNRPTPTIAKSSTRTINPVTQNIVKNDKECFKALPMLASSCPGWICYAEKRHPESIPFISTAKSPHQISGILAKGYVIDELFKNNKENDSTSTLNKRIAPWEVFHITIMACYDRKLEASRLDFVHDIHDKYSGNTTLLNATDSMDAEMIIHDAESASNTSIKQVRETDLVLTSTEVIDMLQSSWKSTSEKSMNRAKMSFNEYFLQLDSKPAPMDSLERNMTSFVTPVSRCSDYTSGIYAAVTQIETGGSGGFLEHIFRFAAQELFGVYLDPNKPLEWSQGRNKDFSEVSLKIKNKNEQSSRTVLRFARAFGFRNIQKIIRLMKRGKCPYDYVEIMACPSGCINGGGQIKAPDDPNTSDHKPSIDSRMKLIKDVNTKFHENIIQRNPEDSNVSKAVYNWIESAPLSSISRRWFHTHYHAVQKMEDKAPMGISW